MEIFFQPKFAEVNEMPKEYTTNIQITLPPNNKAFEISRPIDLNTFNKQKGHRYIRILEQNYHNGVDAIESLGEFQRSVNESRHFVFIKDLKTKEKQLKDAREFGGKVEMETYYTLNDKLEEISQKYNKPFKEICMKFGEVSGDVEALEKYLNGEEVVVWTEFEDMALAHTHDSSVYEYLLETKGIDEIKKRKSYLEIK